MNNSKNLAEFEQFVAELDSHKELDKRYLEIDLFPNALNSLSKTYHFLMDFSDPLRWKWATIALMNALYHFMICALVGGNYQRVLDFTKLPREDKRELENLSSIDNPSNYLKSREIIERFMASPKAKLISFDETLKRIQNIRFMGLYTLSTPISISENELKSIRRLRQTFRNQFEHYRPLGWVIEQELFIPLMLDTLKVIVKLLSNFNLQMFQMRHGNQASFYASWIKRALDENMARLR